MRRLCGPLVLVLAIGLWWCVLAPVVDAVGTTDRAALRDATMHAVLAEQHDERGNPEWDLMRRTFAVLGLADVALAVPEEAERARIGIDAIVQDTLARERARGQYGWLLPYAHAGSFRDAEARSVFVDGEIAMMLAAQHYVEPTPERARALTRRIDALVATMQRGPIGSAESYPNECWTFCNTVALAAIRISDVALQRDHSAMLHGWVDTARARLIDPATGLL
ncbi:MAG TPA: hypothetical protein VG755_43825, partial [Nannocystaceae bacterium]|nr:hypothetical protein [Nannocystaceae bacterium]